MTDAWSITEGYWDTGGEWHATTEATRAALRAAMGGTDREAPPEPPPMWFVERGDHPRLQDRCDLALEDGTVLAGLDELPRDLPVGYHTLQPLHGGPATRLVLTPRRCRLPERAWGWATQLYALRSTSSWGIGDLGDLRGLCSWSAGLGARVTMINPLHASPPCEGQQPSPYFATSRLYRNLLYLRIADIPGASALGTELGRLDTAGRELNRLPRIDRDAVFRLKRDALQRLFDAFEATPAGDDAFEAWRRGEGAPLERFARWCAIAEREGQNFTTWPEELRHPDAPAVADFAGEHARRVRFHEWCQWQLDRQLADAGNAGVQLIADVAVGFDPCGADAWAFQDQLAAGCRVGAPPDTFNPHGQDWGLPPFVPWKLRAAGYDSFVQTIRSAFAHCGGIRIDHVMGLFRLYWIPPEGGPQDGAYVTYPGRELLDIVAVEAERAGGFVVGEDLGTVTDEAQEALVARNILSYRLLWFEEGPPSDLPRRALAAVTTHDLATIAGVWSGHDLRIRRDLGVIDDDGSPTDEPFHSRLIEVGGVADGAPVDEVIVAAHRGLAQAPSLLLLATLDDAVGTPDRPNLPGTIDEWPNWRIPLPLALEELTSLPLAREVAAAMDHGVHVAPPHDPEEIDLDLPADPASGAAP
jgi:4-alpha-glucanotransferase